MSIFKPKPKALFKLGQLVRGDTFGGTAEGYVIYSEFDKQDNKHYFWEEWEITGFEDYDSWIEYDHYTRKITAYEPVKLKLDVNLDPSTLVAGKTLQAPIDGANQMLVVKEVGTGKVVRREGALMYNNVFVGEELTYAEVTFSTGVLSVEKYNNREYDVYKGKVLSVKDQKKMFGRRVEPLNLGWIFPLVVVSVIGAAIIIPATTPTYQNYCTPRSLANSNTQSTDEVVSQDETQTCYRRAVYGGGGGGIGK